AALAKEQGRSHSRHLCPAERAQQSIPIPQPHPRCIVVQSQDHHRALPQRSTADQPQAWRRRDARVNTLHRKPSISARIRSWHPRLPSAFWVSCLLWCVAVHGLQRPWAKASAGGISILPPMSSIYAPVLLARAAFIASSSSPSVVARAVNQLAQPSAFGSSAYFQGARSL